MRARPAVHVRANLGDQLQGGMRTNAVDLAQVGAAGKPVERGADVEGRFMPLRPKRTTRGGQLGARWRLLSSQRIDQLLDCAIALGDLLAVKLVSVEILLEGEQVFDAIVTGEGCDDFLDRGLAAMIAVAGEDRGGAFAVENAAYDLEPGGTGDVA